MSNRSSPGPGGHHLAGAGEDVHLLDRLVRQPAAEARRLDPEPGHRPAERDGLELRHDVRDQAVRQRRVDEVLVGAHALHLGGLALRVDLDDAVEAADVEPGGAAPGPGAEQVGGLLGQPHGFAGRDGVVRRLELAHRCRRGAPKRSPHSPEAGYSRVRSCRVEGSGVHAAAVRWWSSSRSSRSGRRRGRGHPRRRSRGAPRGRAARPAPLSVSTTAASRPREPDETAIATQTPSAETWSDGSATVAAA